MGREQDTRERFFTHVSQDTIEVDVPANTDTPISLTDELLTPLIEEVELYFGVDVYATWALNATEAATRLSNQATRRKFKECMIKSYFRRNDQKKLFVRAVSATTVTVAGIDKEVYYQVGC